MQSVPQPLQVTYVGYCMHAKELVGCVCSLSSPTSQAEIKDGHIYTTGTSTKIRPPVGFEPSSNHQLVGMRFTNH